MIENTKELEYPIMISTTGLDDNM